MKVIMLVGLPGSGKSTWAREHINESTLYLSSDEIRKELYGDASIQTDPRKVFNLMWQRTVRALKSDEYNTIIYDATNLSHKRRAAFCRQVRSNRPDVVIECKIFYAPIETLIARQEYRDRKVPEEVIWRMVKQFQTPLETEGFDDIEIIKTDCMYSADPMILQADAVDYHLSQDNPHHEYTVGKHRYTAHAYAAERYWASEVRTACLLHDIGKSFCKTVDEDGVGHFLGHGELGSYLCLSIGLRVSQLISYHMMFFQKGTKFFDSLTPDFLHQLKQVHEADLAAH